MFKPRINAAFTLLDAAVFKCLNINSFEFSAWGVGLTIIYSFRHTLLNYEDNEGWRH